MRIYYLSTSEIPSKTANSVHVMKMSQALSKSGNDVTLVGIKKSKMNNIFKYYGVDEVFKLIRNKRINIRALGTILNGLKSFRSIKKDKKSELIFGRDIYGIYFCRKLGKDIIYEAHSLPVTSFHRYMEYSLFKRKEFKFLVVISEALKSAYLDKFDILTNEKVLVAPDGADIPKKDENIDFDNQNSLNSEISVGYIGHLYSGRGIEIIIELSKRFPLLEFHIIGGMDKDIKYWQNKCRNTKNVIFHGFIKNGDLGKYYDRLDILLAPYQQKVAVAGDTGDTSKWMSPMKIFEYMSYKKTIISSDLNVLREVLIDRENCLLCKCNDIEDWYEKLKSLIEDKNLRLTLAENGYNDLCTKYTWDIRAKNIMSYLTLVKNRIGV